MRKKCDKQSLRHNSNKNVIKVRKKRNLKSRIFIFLLNLR